MMRPRCLSSSSVALLMAGLASPATAQSQNPWIAACEGSGVSHLSPGYAWERPGPVGTNAQLLKPDRVVTVNDEARAINLLVDRSFVRLTGHQARTFLGDNPISPPSGLRPFLVRAIGAQGLREVRWDGRVLHVTGTAMGACPEMKQLPIIVFLERSPQQVFVDTDGAF